jgi:hypothetical protein
MTPGQKTGMFCSECGRETVYVAKSATLYRECPMRVGWRLFLARHPERHDCSVAVLVWEWPPKFDNRTGERLHNPDVSVPSSDA